MAMHSKPRATDRLANLRAAFEHRFHCEPRVFRAPGRVNLIGEHTDYNDGFVMPAAISFDTWIAASARSDRKLSVVSLDFGEEREFELTGNAAPLHNWSDYVLGVAVVLRAAGYAIGGANLVITGDVPIGAGLSSSASVEMSSALALLGINGIDVDRKELAQLCQQAENEFVGMRCGVMDQFVSAHGRAGHALMLDCRSLEYELLPVSRDVSIVICNSMVKHELANGEYNVRRSECEEGVRILQGFQRGVRALRDVAPDGLEEFRDKLRPLVYRRCRHVVTEDARVIAMADALRHNDLSGGGHLMAQSHESLRDDYEVSSAELDVLVELARNVPGTYGSRMTGGGFGGCTVNLVATPAVEEFRAEVYHKYKEKTGIAPEIYVSTATAGASEIV